MFTDLKMTSLSSLNGLCGAAVRVNSRLCHWRWLNWIVSLSVDLRLQTLLWPLLPGRYGSAAAAIFGGSGRLRSHLCMGCRSTVLPLF